MSRSWISFLSAFGIPLLGICGLFFSMWHAGRVDAPTRDAQTLTFLQDPSPRLDRSMTVCLYQQAKQVARSRAGKHPEGLAKAVSDYNLVAKECTSAVFASTHLPASLAL